MRVSGDAEGCRGTARELRRAAAAIWQQADSVREMRQGVSSWTGQAADAWAARVLAHAESGRALADRVAAVAEVLLLHALALEGLQARGRRLADQAGAVGLRMDDTGWIEPPVQPVAGTGLVPAVEWDVLRPRLDAVREELLGRVRFVQEEEREAHERLARDLGRLGGRAAGGGLPALVSWWDAPPIVLEGGLGTLARSAAAPAAAAAFGRGLVRGLPVVGAGWSVAVDVGVKDAPLQEAVARSAVGTAAGIGAVAAVGATVTGAAAVAAAPVVVPIAVAAVATVAAVSLFDQVLVRTRDPDRRATSPVRPAPPHVPGRQPSQGQPAQGQPDQEPAQPRVPQPAPGPAPARP